MSIKLTLVVAACTGICGFSAKAATIYDLGADFSEASNPNGVWIFGYQQNAGSPLIAYAPQPSVSTFYDWYGDSSVPNWTSFLVPSVFYNPSSTTVTDLSGIRLDSQKVGFHPGSVGELSVIRFTAPVSGDYNYNYALRSADIRGGGPSRVSFVVGNAALNSFDIDSPLSNPGFSGASSIFLNAGDRFDARIAQRSTFFFNAVAIDLTFTGPDSAVPEPASWTLMVAGFGMIGGALRRSAGRAAAKLSV